MEQKKVHIAAGTTEYWSYNGLGRTTVPPASKLKGCKRLDLSNNPITSLETLETIPTLTELRLNNTKIQSFAMTNPQPALRDLYMFGTPISNWECLEIMCICVFGSKLKKLNGILIKRPQVEIAVALREKLTPYLRQGWLLTHTNPVVRCWHYKTHERRTMTFKLPAVQSTPVPVTDSEVPRVKINYRKPALRSASSARENKSENSDNSERKTRIPILSRGQKQRSRSLGNKLREVLNPSNVCLSPSKSIQSFTEIRNEEPVLIENSSMFPPIKSVNDDDPDSFLDHCPSDIDDCALLEDESNDHHFLGVNVGSSEQREYAEETFEDLMAAYQQFEPAGGFGFIDDASSMISCSTAASGISRASRPNARRKFNIDDLRAQLEEDDSDMSDMDEPHCYFREEDFQPARTERLSKKPSTVKFACFV